MVCRSGDGRVRPARRAEPPPSPDLRLTCTRRATALVESWAEVDGVLIGGTLVLLQRYQSSTDQDTVTEVRMVCPLTTENGLSRTYSGGEGALAGPAIHQCFTRSEHVPAPPYVQELPPHSNSPVLGNSRRTATPGTQEVPPHMAVQLVRPQPGVAQCSGAALIPPHAHQEGQHQSEDGQRDSGNADRGQQSIGNLQPTPGRAQTPPPRICAGRPGLSSDGLLPRPAISRHIHPSTPETEYQK